jgi:asparagine synthase (glutamine-hydrolysing)
VTVPAVAGTVATGDDAARVAGALRTIAPDAEPAVATTGPVVVATTAVLATDEHGGVCVLDGWIAGRSRAAAAEQLLAGWRAAGTAVLHDLRGEFAVVLADADRVLLARDPLGTHALFWSRAGRGVRFASEVRPLLALMPATPDPDRRALGRWLAGAELGDEATLFDGIRRVPPGAAVELGGGAATVTRWWRPRFREPAPAGREEAADRVGSALASAVAVRTPAALLLSGGLDSAAVAALGEVRAYTASFPGFRYTDETDRVDALAAELGLDGVRAVAGGSGLLAAGLRHIDRWGLPPDGWSDFWEQPLLRAAAADGCDAVLSGDGGDEVFGVREALLADHLARARPLAAWRLTGRVPGGGAAPRRRRLRYLVDHGARGALPAGVHARLRRRLAEPTRPAWLRPGVRADLAEHDGVWAWQQRLDGPRWWAAKARELTERIEALGLLDHLRRRALGAGLEARHPILSLEVVETVLDLPPEVFLDPVHDRRPLRDALRGRLGDGVRLRAGKATFNRVVGANVLDELPAIERVLAQLSPDLRALTGPQAVRDLLDQTPRGHPHGELYWVREVLRLTMAECWLRELAAPGTARAMLSAGWFGDPEPQLTPLRMTGARPRSVP